ncbi:MAG: hypothetical protein FJY10_09980 [Bacteroidetes bacterium]|nr:hypothetical protein [Bacteroidota bacterium]
MNDFFNSSNLIRLLLKWKFHLLIISVVVILLGVLFSSPWFISPLYKSTAVLYPANVSPYSEESETEQMLQLIQSKDIKDSVIRRFDLAKHYKVDSGYKYFETIMLYEWSKRVKINKTPYESIMLEVLDRDPDTACKIAESIIHYYDIKVRILHREKFYEVVMNFRSQVIRKSRDLDSLAGRIHELGTKYGVLDFQSQTREVMEGYLRTIDGSNAQRINTPAVMELKKNLEDKGGEMLMLQELLTSESEAFSTFKLDYDRALIAYQRHFTYSNVVTKPFPADKKSYPVRWIIVLGSLIASLFVAIIVIGFIENSRRIIHKRNVVPPGDSV